VMIMILPQPLNIPADPKPAESVREGLWKMGIRGREVYLLLVRE